jgi:hypothetical protein
MMTDDLMNPTNSFPLCVVVLQVCGHDDDRQQLIRSLFALLCCRYVDMMMTDDLMNDKLLIEVFSDNGITGRNEFLGQALIPVRAGIEYCSRPSQPSIELRLLEHDDFTPWEPNDPKTNAGGSSKQIPATSSIASFASERSESQQGKDGNSPPSTVKALAVSAGCSPNLHADTSARVCVLTHRRLVWSDAAASI